MAHMFAFGPNPPNPPDSAPLLWQPRLPNPSPTTPRDAHARPRKRLSPQNARRRPLTTLMAFTGLLIPDTTRQPLETAPRRRKTESQPPSISRIRQNTPETPPNRPSWTTPPKNPPPSLGRVPPTAERPFGFDTPNAWSQGRAAGRRRAAARALDGGRRRALERLS